MAGLFDKQASLYAAAASRPDSSPSSELGMLKRVAARQRWWYIPPGPSSLSLSFSLFPRHTHANCCGPLKCKQTGPLNKEQLDRRIKTMAGLFDEQASLYATARPDYPSSLFSFLASLSSHHGRAWDVGTGSGQAAMAIAEYYDFVIATDTSESQLQHARRRHNIKYVCTQPLLSGEDLENIVGGEGSIDIITVAQALHWFDLDSFYANVKKVLRKPGGILAAWCYTEPSICTEVDAVFWDFLRESGPYWEPARKIVDDEYKSLPFPFEPVCGILDGTGPFHFESKKAMDVEMFLTYLGSMSVLRCARSQGIELLHESQKSAFRTAWGDGVRMVTFHIHLRVGCVQ